MMRSLLAAIAIAVVLIAPLAQADQCQGVDPRVASRAVAAIRASHGRLLAHCAPCGDPQPTLAAAFTPREVHSDGRSVVVDGHEVDLAYLYLEVRPGWFENIALRTGCEAFDVPRSWIFRATSVQRSNGFGPIPPALRAVGWGFTDTHRAQRPLPPG